MIQSATFSMDESQNILKTFLIDYDISKVIQKFVKREPIHLREHIKRIIRQTIINIEAHLFKAGKIPSLLLYDNQSDQMFEAFMNLKEIIPETEKDNFYLNFVNMKSEGCRIMRFGRTDYHVSINSEQRERIYARFISYTEHNYLYKYAITRKDEDSNVQTPPYSDPCKLFSQRDLEFIFKTYCVMKGDISRMALYFRSKGIEDPRFEAESLEQSIPNLMLIGYYLAHKKSAETGQTQLIRWAQFRDKYPLPEQCDLKAKIVWIRIAIREDPEHSELKWIQKIQKKKIVTNPVKRSQPPKKGPNLDHKKWRKGKECVISHIKEEMQKSILKRVEDDNFSISVVPQSARTLKSGFTGRNKPIAQKQPDKKSVSKASKQNAPVFDQDSDSSSFEEQKLSKREMAPEFVKKIQKQCESQSVIEEMDEKDVVWQQIPDKPESSQPSQQAISAPNSSVKFYSEKPNYDKASKQPSIRSQKNKDYKPKQIEHKNKVKNDQSPESSEPQNYDDYQGEEVDQGENQGSQESGMSDEEND